MKLSFEHISKLYGDTAALQQLDLTLRSGVYGLLGPNGAGKTLWAHIYNRIRSRQGIFPVRKRKGSCLSGRKAGPFSAI